jgi:hypothetical protein
MTWLTMPKNLALCAVVVTWLAGSAAGADSKGSGDCHVIGWKTKDGKTVENRAHVLEFDRENKKVMRLSYREGTSTLTLALSEEVASGDDRDRRMVGKGTWKDGSSDGTVFLRFDPGGDRATGHYTIGADPKEYGLELRLCKFKQR